ncbi:MAG TPA: biotin--[acetyl-CoA-carboxylase] ligase [Solirubrobacteraceae bacterium]|nr:biotin--[acetyl-CoA-carboxylase] ligase [Solirubrobacteraceae bacterium]
MSRGRDSSTPGRPGRLDNPHRPDNRHRLDNPDQLDDPDRLGNPHRLDNPDRLGRPRLHLRRTDSTNARARALALAGAPHGTLVTAAEQTAGRGRQGRRWSAPAGSSLLVSLVLRERHLGSAESRLDETAGHSDCRSPALLPLAAAVAVCDVAGADARIKWPNDIVFERSGAGTQPLLAKVAGILVEARPQEGWAVLGIGLNAALRIADLPAELHATAATLGLSRDALEPLLDRLLGALERRLGEGAAETLAAWRARDALRGREIAWTTGGARADGHGRAEAHGRADEHGQADGIGRADGIDNAGRLIVALPDGGCTALGAGEVHLAAAG